jgi:hypothetical protein
MLREHFNTYGMAFHQDPTAWAMWPQETVSGSTTHGPGLLASRTSNQQEHEA